MERFLQLQVISDQAQDRLYTYVQGELCTSPGQAESCVQMRNEQQHCTVSSFLACSLSGIRQIQERSTLFFYLLYRQSRSYKNNVRKSESTCVSVEVVPQQRDCPKSPATEMAFMWSFISVAFHVAVQVGTTRTSITAQFALECLLYT